MRQRTIRQGVYLAGALALGAIALDSMTNASVHAQLVREPIFTAPIGLAPLADPQKAAPADDLQSAARQTAAIVDGIVTDIRYDYSEEDGPWTTVILSKARPIAGSAPETIAIRHFGGPLPNGGFVVASELPVFVRDKEYIVFLRNTVWNVSPVVDDLAFRVDTVDTTEVVADSDGQPVLQVSAAGFERGPALFGDFERDGLAPKPVDGALRTLTRAPLARDAFIKSLQANLAAQGLQVGGTFSEKPAGAFKWRAQLTAPTPGAITDPTGGVPNKEPELDASELQR
jgi:hypothetical protein